MNVRASPSGSRRLRRLPTPPTPDPSRPGWAGGAPPPGWLRAVALALGGCADPPLDPGADPLLAALAGEVVLDAGVIDPAGDPPPVFVTVFGAADPPPPAGTGSPTTFAAISPAAFTGGGATVRSAPWAITRLPEGAWLVGALADVDGDFQPFAPALAGATCGDWGGAHLAALGAADPAPIAVAAGERVAGVTVLVGARYDLERPAFRLASAAPVPAASLVADVPAAIALAAVEVHADYGAGLVLDLGPACPPAPGCEGLPACPCAEVAPCGAALWAYVVDADADGVPDPHPEPDRAAAGLRDVWPRVYLAAEGEPWVDDAGVERVEDWVSEAFPLARELGGVLAAGGDPASVAPVGAPFPAASLSVTLPATFLHHHAGGADGVDARGPYDVVVATDPALPAAFAVTLVSFTGQTWTVPNETATLPSPGPGDPGAQAVGLLLAR